MKKDKKVKILELYYDENNKEQYTIKIEKGFSRVEATAHFFRAAAEGLIEIQEALLPILDKADNDVIDEFDILIKDSDDSIGYASVHHNGECYISTMYQDRLDLELDKDDMFQKLSEGKAYIAECDTPIAAIQKIMSFWYLDLMEECMQMDIDLSNIQHFQDFKAAANSLKNSDMPIIVCRVD